MKKKVMFVFIFLFLLIISVSLIFATEEAQVQKAYSWLANQTNTTTECNSFTFETKAFTLLAIGNCENETWQDNETTSTTMCWPKGACKVKSTAIGILALNEKYDTTKGETWLLQQTTAPPSTMEWFLEIESPKATTCWVNYSGTFNQIKISEDKKILTNAGNSLTLTPEKYWLKIASSLYNKPINVSCNESFITTLLFKDQGSVTVHVSGIVHSASANGKTAEQIDSLCFKEGTSCNYESSLWATFVLRLVNNDAYLKFMPYLITKMDDPQNKRYIPESFLYYITGEFETELLTQQKNEGYWDESGNRYYDTALAMLPLYHESPTQKEAAKTWLLSVQHNLGFWENTNSILDNAFILYSVWLGAPQNDYCNYDSECPEYSCATPSCEYGECFSYSFECSGNTEDGCCPEGCITATDSDCTPGENVCTNDNFCEEEGGILPTEKPYCSKDKKEAWINDSEWDCKNKICTVIETPDLIETCDEGETCRLGECLENGTISDECTTDDDCLLGETCIDGECISEECTSSYDCSYGTCVEGSCTADCETAEYFCMNPSNCEGYVLEEYSCPGISSCCDTKPTSKSCSDQEGEICSSEEYCFEGTTDDYASDLGEGETCCLGGTCEEEIISSACGDNDGECRQECEKSEEENYDYTCDFDEKCCLPQKDKPSYAWIWILLVLILFSALGIVFRDKLRVLLLQLKEKFGKKKERKPFEMPMTHSFPQGRILSRPISHPPLQTSPVRKPFSPIQHPSGKKPEEKPKNELDDVLKKLKEMGK